MTITTRAQLHALREEQFAKASAIMVEKNKDYGSETDALANFRTGAACAGTTHAQAILNRLGDKVHRLQLAAAGAPLAIEDNDGPDLLNLTILVMAAIRERRAA